MHRVVGFALLVSSLLLVRCERQADPTESIVAGAPAAEGSEPPAAAPTSVYDFMPTSGSALVIQRFEPLAALSRDFVEPMMGSSALAKEADALTKIVAVRGFVLSDRVDRSQPALLLESGQFLFAGQPLTALPGTQEAPSCEPFEALPGYQHCSLDGELVPLSPGEDLRNQAKQALPNSHVAEAPLLAVIRMKGLRSLAVAHATEGGFRIDADMEEFFDRKHPVFVPRRPSTTGFVEHDAAFSWVSANMEALAYYGWADDKPFLSATALSGQAVVGRTAGARGIVVALERPAGVEGEVTEEQGQALASLFTLALGSGRIESKMHRPRGGRGNIPALGFSYAGDALPAWAKKLGFAPELWHLELAGHSVYMIGGSEKGVQSIDRALSTPKPLPTDRAPQGVRDALSADELALLTFVPLGAVTSPPFVEFVDETGLLDRAPAETRSPLFLMLDSFWAWLRVSDKSTVLHFEVSLYPELDDPHRAEIHEAFSKWSTGTSLNEALRALGRKSKLRASTTRRLRRDPAVVSDALATLMVLPFGYMTPLLAAAEINGLRSTGFNR